MDFLQEEEYRVFITKKNPYKDYEVYECLFLNTNKLIFKVKGGNIWNIVISEEMLKSWCIYSVYDLYIYNKKLYSREYLVLFIFQKGIDKLYYQYNIIKIGSQWKGVKKYITSLLNF